MKMNHKGGTMNKQKDRNSDGLNGFNDFNATERSHL